MSEGERARMMLIQHTYTYVTGTQTRNRAQAHTGRRRTYRGFHLRCHAGFAVVVMRARAVTVE